MTSTIQIDTPSLIQMLVQLQGMLLPLCLFTFLATATPGPNNILLTLSGSQFGFRKSLPFIIGIRLGIGIIFLLMGIGVGSLILSYPQWYLALKYLGAAYLVYLAIKIAFSTKKSEQHKEPSLISFRQGVLLQFINPKSMMMVLSCVTAFSLPGELYTLSVIQGCIVFTFVGTFSNSCWVLFGVAINRLLSTDKSQLIFNRSLALMTLIAVALLFY